MNRMPVVSSEPLIAHLSTVSHDGKVVVVGTGYNGVLYYTIRQSGFEDTVTRRQEPASLDGFENWRLLPLDKADIDQSVIEFEAQRLTDKNHKPILRSLYGDSAARTSIARTKLLSGLGHLYVFRASPDNKLVANRFVLDGLTNELVPKMEVRYRRSGQRLTPDGGAGNRPGSKSFDSLGSRSVDDEPFCEPAIELSFAGEFVNGKPWFSVELTNTGEHGKFRWHFFVYTLKGLQLFTVAASREGLFEVRDSLGSVPDPSGSGKQIQRSLPGIIARTLEFEGDVVNAFDSCLYHNQIERETKSGPQLLKQNTRVMLSVPLKRRERNVVEVAAVSFAVNSLGMLAQIARSGSPDEFLRAERRQVLLPLATLEDAKLIADRSPPLEGTITRLDESPSELVEISTENSVAGQSQLKPGGQVEISGTKSYDGVYTAQNIVRGDEGNSFEIEADFEQAEGQGHWKAIETEPDGLIFENMIASYERTESGLKITCLSHNIEDGDEIRISGSVSHDGVYPIRTVGQEDDNNTFEIERVWPLGEAVNLRYRRRRGLAFDGTGDFLEIGPVKLPGNAPRRRLERTVSAWIWVPDVTLGAEGDIIDARIETVFCNTGNTIHLFLDKQGRPTFEVRFADGHLTRVRSDKPVSTSRWVHLAAQLSYDGEHDGSTQLYIIVNGRIEGSQKTDIAKPLHLPLRNAFLNGNGMPLSIGTQTVDYDFPESITLEAWINTAQSKNASVISWEQNGLHRLGLQGGAGNRVVEWVNNGEVAIGKTPLTSNRWHHIAASYNDETGERAIYVNGVIDHQSVSSTESALAARRRELEAEITRLAASVRDAEQSAELVQMRVTEHEQSLDKLDAMAADWHENIETAKSQATAAQARLNDVEQNLHRLQDEENWLRESFDTRGPVGDLVGNTHTSFLSVAIDDSASLAGIDMRSGSWLDALQLVPSSGSIAALGGDGGELHEFRFADGEWLVAIHGRFDGDHIHSLRFITNTGAAFPDGSLPSETGDAFTLDAPGGCEIYGLWGYADSYVDALGISVRTDPASRQFMEIARAAVLQERSELDNSPVHAAALQASDEARQARNEIDTRMSALDMERSQIMSELEMLGFELDELVMQAMDAQTLHRRAVDALEGPLRTVQTWEAIDRVSKLGEPLVLGFVGGVISESDARPVDRFRGALAEVRAWSTVRTQAQILASSTMALEGTEAGLVGYWTLAETVARQMNDNSPYKAHLIRPERDPVEWRTVAHRVPGQSEELQLEYYHDTFSVAALLQPVDQDAVVFSGVGDHLQIPALKQNLPDGYTVSGWFWLNRFEGASFIELGSNREQGHLHIRCTEDAGALQVESSSIADGAVMFTCFDAIRLGEWVHMALSVKPDGQAQLLINAQAQPEWQGQVTPITRFDRRSNFIGTRRGNDTSHLDGQVRDIQLWDIPLDIAGVKRSMHATISENSNHLLHRWTMKTKRVESATVAVDSGAATAAPAELMGSAVEVAVGVSPAPVNEFRGRISELQLWALNQPADSIRNVMHNALSGSENGLIGYWKLGGIAELSAAGSEEPMRITPDFYVEPHDATVHGDVYVSECELARANSVGKAVRYSNDELVAVTQGGRYRETLEFRAVDGDGYVWNLDDAADADHLGSPIFGFRYWGKSSRFSEDIIEMPHTDFSFQKVGDGWLRATAEVTIPKGVNLIRSFELDQVRGRWTNQQQAPDDEWVQLSLRRQRLELVSDSVSKRVFVDEIPLATLSSDASNLKRSVSRLPGLERQVAVRLEKLDDVHERLDALSNQPKYQREHEGLKRRRDQLNSQVASLNTDIDQFSKDPLNYVQRILAREAGSYLDFKGVSNLICIWKDGKKAPLEWEFFPAGKDRPGQYRIRERGYDWYLTCYRRGNYEMRAQSGDPYIHPGQYWKIHRYGNVYEFENVEYGGYLDVYAHGRSNGSRVVVWDQTNKINQEWRLEPARWIGFISVLAVFTDSRNYWKKREGFDRDINILIRQKESASGQLPAISSRLARLSTLLKGNDNAEELEQRRNTLESQVLDRQNTINEINTNYLREAKSLQAEASTMSMVARDADNLTTYGALLGFASPATGLVSTATAEGNVQLGYFDQSGAMRFTNYDATSDRVNALFEQWIPDSIRACPGFSRQGAMLNLDHDEGSTETPAERREQLTLPARDFTIETWFHHPASSVDIDGQSVVSSKRHVFLSDATGDHAPIAIFQGRRLGVIVDGFFHDAGVDFDTSLSKGWHHLAARTRGAHTSFFIDGDAVGRTEEEAREINLFSAHFGGNGNLNAGATNLVRESTTSITMQFWAKWSSFSGKQSPVDARIDQSRRLFVWASGSGDTGSLHINSHALPPPGAPSTPHPFGALLSARRALQLNEWVNIAVCIDGSEQSSVGVVYLNGREVARSEIVLPKVGSTQTTSFGRNPDGSSFNGALSQVQLWNSVLTIDDIQRRMFVPPPVSTDEGELPAGLVHYWSMSATGSAENRRIEDHVKEDGLPAIINGAPLLSRLDAFAQGTITTIGNNAKGNSPAGMLSELRIWNVALSDEEIRANSRMILTGNEPDLMAYYPLTDVLDGQVARDKTGRYPDAVPSAMTQTVACTANIGHPGVNIAMFNGGDSTIEISNVNLQKTSFTIELWVRRHDAERNDFLIEHGPHRPDECLHMGFRSSGSYFFSFWGNSLNATLRDEDNNVRTGENEWLHFAHVWTYDNNRDLGEQRLYVNGQYHSHQSDRQALRATGKLIVGASQGINAKAEMAEIRIWKTARTAEQIGAKWNRRLSSVDETGLEFYLPLDGTSQSFAANASPINFNNVPFVRVDDLPIVPGSSVVTAEYSTVSPDPENRALNRAMLRRFVGVPIDGGRIDLVAGKRIEELDLKWIGNAQFEPTLLGYIEGAPPVPSENLTVSYDYDGATSIELRRSEEVSYSWNRSKDIGGGFDINAFIGAKWDADVEIGFIASFSSKLTEGRVGLRGSLATNWRKEESSTIRSDSTQTSTDALELRGSFELDPQFPLIGPRYVPKNVGYALVVSGMADVFVLQMKRTGRMVDYEVKPVADVPMDINTVTFLINPGYQINGSVDGLVGTQAADQRVYKDVPDMRAQYGSLYPAGYFNPEEAYHIKGQIDRWDEQRRTYFENFDVRETGLSDGLLDQIDQQADQNSGGIDIPSRNSVSEDDGDTSEEADELEAQAKEKQAENKSAAKNKRKEIDSLFRDSDKNTEAAAAFSAWQRRMEGLQVRSAKRNIVNNYVWDGDGGLRTEEQSYANTIEHTLGGSFSLNASLGLEADISVVAVGIELSAMANLEMTQSMSKTAEQTETLELNVRLDALEHKGITDAEDYPILPGEKVDRYRFMSFYLEGDTDHFHDFFNQVVDPEWLMSNDEEARALRQVAAGRANKTWRVMHRVTYVERPALMGIGRDVRLDESLEDLSEQVYSQFDDLAKDTDLIKSDLGEVSAKLSDLERKIDGLAAGNPPAAGPVDNSASESSGTVASPTDPAASIPPEPPEPADVIPVTDPDRALLMVLNEGDKKALIKLKGIGQVRAAAIIQWRRTRTFHSLDDLAEIIGRGTVLDLSSDLALQDNG